MSNDEPIEYKGKKYRKLESWELYMHSGRDERITIVPIPEPEPARPLVEELTDRFYQDCGMNISVDGLTTETKMLCRVLDKRFKEKEEAGIRPSASLCISERAILRVLSRHLAALKKELESK